MTMLSRVKKIHITITVLFFITTQLNGMESPTSPQKSYADYDEQFTTEITQLPCCQETMSYNDRFLCPKIQANFNCPFCKKHLSCEWLCAYKFITVTEANHDKIAKKLLTNYSIGLIPTKSLLTDIKYFWQLEENNTTFCIALQLMENLAHNDFIEQATYNFLVSTRPPSNPRNLITYNKIVLTFLEKFYTTNRDIPQALFELLHETESLRHEALASNTTKPTLSTDQSWDHLSDKDLHDDPLCIEEEK